MSIAPTEQHTLDEALDRASRAFPEWSRTPRAARGRALRAAAAALEDNADTLIGIAAEETHLGEPRLRGELRRTAFQLSLLAEVIERGSHLDARIDHADAEWGMGPRPDIRRIMRPLGPVLVFSASNFPFAFSVAGGDTASALAAGCPVVVKAHSGHPRLSDHTGGIVAAALTAAGAPEGILAVIHGQAAGVAAIQDPRIAAAGFTGSIPGGRRLFDLAVSRDAPIPFYGELGSVNPVFVTERADRERGEQIAEGFAQSFTLGNGQFCTKPGVLFVPRGGRVATALAAAVVPEPAPMLNDRIRMGFDESLEALRSRDDVTALVESDPTMNGIDAAPSLYAVTLETFKEHASVLREERFGPASLVVTYDTEDALAGAAKLFPGQLTAAIHGVDDDAIAGPLVDALGEIAGRVLWNEWPTGVTVTYAQQHGGPYPATTASGTTSVGTAAIDRFLRPVAYQNLPQALLPSELRDDNAGIPVLVNGRLELP